MTVYVRGIGRVDQPIHVAPKFTLGDIPRFGAPVAVGGLAAGVPGAAVGAVVGGVVGAARPFGHRVEHLLWHLPRWTVRPDDNLGPESVVVDDGLLRLADDTYVGVVAVEPTNLSMMFEDEQTQFHRDITELLDGLDTAIEFHSVQEPGSFDAYIDALDPPDAAPESVVSSYRHRCNQYGRERTPRTRHFAVVTGDDTTVRKTCDSVASGLTTGDVSAEIVDVGRGNEKPLYNVFESVSTHPRQVERQGQYRRGVYLRSFPQQVKLGWPDDVLQVPGQVDVVQRVSPVPNRDLVRRLRRFKQRMRMNQDLFVGTGSMGREGLQARIEDVQWFLDHVTGKRDEHGYRYEAYIVAKGDTPEECDRVFEDVQAELDRAGIRYREPVCRMDKLARSVMPGVSGGLDEDVLVPGSTAAAGAPFVSQSVNEGRGIILGEDVDTGRPVLTDRWQWPGAGHILRVGATGAGKTWKTGMEIIRSALFYDELDVFVIDPKDDYGDLTAKMGGDVVTVGQAGDITATPGGFQTFQFTAASEQGRNELVAETADSVYQTVTGNERRTLVVIDEAHRLLEHRQGSDVLKYLVREARGSQTAVTAVTQTIRELLRTDGTKVIVDNTPCLEVMRHFIRVPEAAERVFALSPGERSQLTGLATGDADGFSESLVKIGGDVSVKVRNRPTDTERRLLPAVGDGGWEGDRQ